MEISLCKSATLSKIGDPNNPVFRYIAGGPWNALSDAEKDIVCSEGFFSEGGIKLTKISQRFYDEFYSEVYPKLSTNSESNKNKIKNYLSGLRNTIKDELDSNVKILGVEHGDLVLNPPGIPSTAFNYDKGICVGMHIDDHQKLDFNKRESGFQLLNINLGEATRYICFVNYSFRDIFKKVREKTDEHIQSAKALKDLFFHFFPNTPLYRISILPKEAYIAVTQNFIHDGNTNNDGKLDISLLLGGEFIV